MKVLTRSYLLFTLALFSLLTLNQPAQARSPISSIINKIAAESGGSISKRVFSKRILEKLPPLTAKTFFKKEYSQRILKKPLTVYRYHGDYNIKPAKYAFLTRDRYFNEVQIRKRLAIPDPGVKGPLDHKNHPIRWVSIYQLPKDTLISEGRVAPYKHWPGGGNQIVVKDLEPQYRVQTVPLKKFSETIQAAKH